MSNRKGSVRPHLRKYPDPLENEQYIAFLRARAQEKFLGREWQLTIEDWMKIWGRQLWFKRGRKTNDLALTRIDWNKPWHRDNVVLMTRADQIRMSTQRHMEIRHGKSLQ